MQPPARLLVVNGPNLNLLGTRQPEIYGSETLADLETACHDWGQDLGIAVDTFQSNHEGAIIDRLHQARHDAEAVIINPGALTHYSYAIYDALEAIELPAVEIHISDVTRREPWRRQSVIGPACVRTLYGRGTGAYRDALRHLVFRAKRPVFELPYGDAPDQVGDLRVPDGPGPHPVAVLIHGGFWRRPWQRDLMDGVAVDLVDRGVATWNIEYRCGPGTWEETLEDVGAAVDHVTRLAGEHPIDPGRVAVVGHSAGGHLALWVTGRPGLRSPGPAPAVVPVLGMSIAGVVDLAAAVADHLGDDAVHEFFGEIPDLAATSPRHMLPLGTPQMIVHGTVDEQVPVTHSRSYAELARAAGDPVDYRELDGADHSVVVDERSPEWDAVAVSIVSRLTDR